jgi:2-keto-3-deoxy-L-rhamnonate aldolase RhmA
MIDAIKIKTNISCGSWIQSGCQTISEIMALAGFDWICVDLEHTDTDWNTFTNIIKSVKSHDVIPFARVSENDTLAIRKPLDLGAMGVIVPLINNAEEAKRAVAAAKYPPEGIRGFAFCQANEWGKIFDEYVKEANKSIIVIMMIESREAVENIDEILSVEGVDGAFIGPYDLSGSYGIPGQISAPIVLEGMKKVLAACKRHGKLAGQHIVSPNKENVENAVKQGYEFLALGMDTVIISDGSRRILEMLK